MPCTKSTPSWTSGVPSLDPGGSDQLGVDYNAHAIGSILEHVAPALGWR